MKCYFNFIYFENLILCWSPTVISGWFSEDYCFSVSSDDDGSMCGWDRIIKRGSVTTAAEVGFQLGQNWFNVND